MFEIFIQLFFEVILQILFEVGGAVGWEVFRDAFLTERHAPPGLAAVGHFLAGSLAGAVSLFIFRNRITPSAPVPGLSLILSPFLTGMAMSRLGVLWRGRSRDWPALFTFRAGALFAFAMALFRFAYFYGAS